jgi:beta-lactamase class A
MTIRTEPGQIPDTQVGQQLRWLLTAANHLPISDVAFSEHFAVAFRDQISAAQLNATLAGLFGTTGLKLVRITQASSAALAGVVQGSTQLQLNINVDAGGEINGLRFSSANREPATWADLDRQLARIAPTVSFVAAEVTGGGDCRLRHALHATASRPLGSLFKLYVLGALVNQILGGRVSWTQPVVIQDRLKSLPSGVLQDAPAGTTITVEQTAREMISISDNTAADHLLALVGRSAVQAQLRQWSQHAKLDTPFLSTRELAILKYVDYPTLAAHYLRLSPTQREAYLNTTIDQIPLSQIRLAGEPREVDTIEWNASATDLCQAFGHLSQLSQQAGLAPLGQLFELNSGGIQLDPATWSTVWFKGGSEPGVLALGYLARTRSGRTFVVAALAENPQHALNQVSTLQLVTLIRGAFKLLA